MTTRESAWSTLVRGLRLSPGFRAWSALILGSHDLRWSSPIWTAQPSGRRPVCGALVAIFGGVGQARNRTPDAVERTVPFGMLDTSGGC
ncbi:MAG: hypothetical protein ACRDZ4_04550 [Egibacteraceae bacterium]